MKTIVSALVALSFMAGIAAPASATPDGKTDARTFYDKLDRDSRGGRPT